MPRNAPFGAGYPCLSSAAPRSWEELLSAGGNVSEYLEARRREFQSEFGGANRGAGCLSALPRAVHLSSTTLRDSFLPSSP